MSEISVVSQQIIDYGLLAARAYENSRVDPITGHRDNMITAPAGWTELVEFSGLNSSTLQGGLGHAYSDSGFEAVAFRKGEEIVISYAGLTLKPLMIYQPISYQDWAFYPNR